MIARTVIQKNRVLLTSICVHALDAQSLTKPRSLVRLGRSSSTYWTHALFRAQQYGLVQTMSLI